MYFNFKGYKALYGQEDEKGEQKIKKKLKKDPHTHFTANIKCVCALKYAII